ncbi:MAG: hypothetical protein U5L11_10190 [Arhodomonas sp.]|nr:hypothetical protein [Arhodomonas sp.]
MVDAYAKSGDTLAVALEFSRVRAGGDRDRRMPRRRLAVALLVRLAVRVTPGDGIRSFADRTSAQTRPAAATMQVVRERFATVTAATVATAIRAADDSRLTTLRASAARGR